MKKILIFIILLISFSSQARKLEVEISSLTNIKGGGAMEACGVVTNQLSKTSLVTIKHE